MVVFSVVAGSSNRFRVICLWVEAEWERKGNSICMEGEKKKKKKKNREWRDWMLPGIVPLVTEAKWRGQDTVQIFQDGTGQHEKVQLHFWQSGEGERAVVMKPVSHEVLIVLGVASIKRCIVKVIFELCFQTTSSYDPLLLLFSFVLL